jgi:cell division protease FtsH
MSEPTKSLSMNKKPNRKRWYIIGGAVLLILAIAGGVYYYKDTNKNTVIPLSEAILLSKSNIFGEMDVQGNNATLIVADEIRDRESKDINNNQIKLQGGQKIDVLLASLNLKDLVEIGFVPPAIYKENTSAWNSTLWTAPLMGLIAMSLMFGFIFLIYKTDILVGRASQFKKAKNSIYFTDIGGLDGIKDSLLESVSFLKDRKYLVNLGAKIPHGILLTGAPGVGKTMLARAIAAEADVPFYFCAGSELQSYWFGMTSQRIKKIFKLAKASPSIIFIDEIESIAQKRSFRGTDVGRDNDMTMNQLLAELDGFDNNGKVLVIAATNHPEVLDPAVLRPGRFDRQISIPLPDFKERCAILEIHGKNKPLARGISTSDIAKQTSGMSGADLAAIWNESSIIAGRGHKEAIDMDDINKALDRVIAGCERKGTILTDTEKKLVAAHEAGHTLVASILPGCDKVQRVSILPHGDTGGFTRLSSEEEPKVLSKSKAESMISMLFGGRIAEEMVVGDISSSAQNDLMKANQIAKEMVECYGMGDTFGARYCAQNNMGIKEVSIETHNIIDKDVAAILDTCYTNANRVITDNRGILDKLTDGLIKNETLNADEVSKIIGRKL